jgi:hypothetical protein
VGSHIKVAQVGDDLAHRDGVGQSVENVSEFHCHAGDENTTLTGS